MKHTQRERNDMPDVLYGATDQSHSYFRYLAYLTEDEIKKITINKTSAIGPTLLIKKVLEQYRKKPDTYWPNWSFLG